MEKYPSMYYMNNSGRGKQRELSPGNYFAIISPSLVVGDASYTFKHVLVFMDPSYNNLKSQLNDFMRRNRKKVDIQRSNDLISMVTATKQEAPSLIAKGNKSAELSDRLSCGLEIGKTIKRTYFGPENNSWVVYKEKPEEVLYGKDRVPDTQSYWFN